MTLEIRLHLGAHKTASTYLQQFFAANIAELKRMGVSYVPLRRMRTLFTNRFNALSRDNNTRELATLGRDFIAELRRSRVLSRDTQTLVLSDENLLGWLAACTQGRRLYGLAKERTGWLREIFKGAEVKFFLAVRSQQTFFPSVYAEVFRNGHILPFDAFLTTVKPCEFSWSALVADVADGADNADVRVWRYEAMAEGRFNEIARALAGVPVDAFRSAPEKIVRPSLPAKAFEILLNSRLILSQGESRRLLEILASSFEFDSPSVKLAISDDVLLSMLSEKYACDLEQLKGSGFMLPI